MEPISIVKYRDHTLNDPALKIIIGTRVYWISAHEWLVDVQWY